jgi:hypothetical protein
MKKNIFSIALVVFGVLSTFAQIGIGTTSPNVNASFYNTTLNRYKPLPLQ